MLAASGYSGPVATIPCPASFRGMTRDGIVQKTYNSLEDLFIAAGLSKPKTVAAAVSEDGAGDSDGAEGEA